MLFAPGRTKSRIAVAAALMLGIMASAGVAAELPPAAAALIAKRETVGLELSKPIAYCVGRKDTDHIAFRGCVDWHSAVHGTWALTAYGRMTGDARYEPLVRVTLLRRKIEGERLYVKERPQFELPYGRAWLLRLAIDHRRQLGHDGLKAFADEVMTSLIAYYRAKPPVPGSGSYDSASWALINLFDYAQATGNERVLQTVRGWIERYFARHDARCDYGAEHGHFMAVCTNWAWLVSRVKTRQDLTVWLDQFFSKSGMPTPVTSPVNWHHYGLNFSRSWGLAGLYKATGDRRFAEAWAAHFAAAYDTPRNWRGSYMGVAHYVPQFGMLALQQMPGPDNPPR